MNTSVETIEDKLVDFITSTFVTYGLYIILITNLILIYFGSPYKLVNWFLIIASIIAIIKDRKNKDYFIKKQSFSNFLSKIKLVLSENFL